MLWTRFTCVRSNAVKLKSNELFFIVDTTPPKSILQSEISLLDSNCVPSAVVHFGLDLDKAMPEGVKYIKSNLFAHFISPSIASLAAARSR